MKLITELNQNIETITEGTDESGKYYYLTGVFMQSEIRNRNGRVYPRGVMENALGTYVNEKINNKTAYGELGHPASATINPERISHLIESLTFDGNDVIGRAKVLNTTMGKEAQKILEGGGRLGVSSRGLGSLKEANGAMIVGEDFHIATAADIVTDPSAPAAYVNGILENIDWFYDNTTGLWGKRVVEVAHHEMKKLSAKQINEQKVELFQRYINKISKGL